MGRMDRMGVRAEKESCLTAFMITMILVWVRVFLKATPHLGYFRISVLH